MIKIENLKFKYKEEKYVLNDINLEINEGECIAIIGKNGSGKSTLAKLISGIVKPTKGDVFVDEINTRNKKEYINLRKKIGIVFQNPENQIIFNNIEDELSFALKNLKIEDINLRIEEALKKVKIEKDKVQDLDELSLGQKQKITIASVIAINPKYIVLDEPTTMIDSEGKEAVYRIIKDLKESGYTIIYITNNIEEILMADRILILDNGKIAQNIKKEELKDNNDLLRKYNLKIPSVLRIMEELKKNGINIEVQDFTIDEVIKKIIGEINEKRS